MKHYLPLLLLPLAIACKNEISTTAKGEKTEATQQSEDGTKRRMASIEKDIDNNAMGIDIGYQPGKLDTVVIASKQQVITDLAKEFQMDTMNVQQTIGRLNEMSEKARAENDATNFHLYAGLAENLAIWDKMRGEETAFSVYKYVYTIKNLMDATKRKEVTNYYIFDQKDSLVGQVDDMTMKEYKGGLIATDLQPYRVLLVALQRDIKL